MEIEVTTPIPNGKGFESLTVGFRFDMYVFLCMLGEAEEVKNIDLSNQDILINLFFYANLSYARMRGSSDMSKDKMKTIFQNMPNKTASEIVQCFIESKNGAGSIKEEIEKHYTTEKKSKKKISLLSYVKSLWGSADIGQKSFIGYRGEKQK
jgi:hypothetical protein